MTDAALPHRLASQSRALMPGVLIAAIMALASQFIADHYGAPAMLLALLFGMSLNFLGEEARTRPGLDFGSKKLLRLGVALLGARISADVLQLLGWELILLVVGGVAATISFGLLAAQFFGFRYRFAFLSAGAVAICGASAAMSIAAILPKDDRSEQRLIFTVVGVTVLSTLAMIVYPVFSSAIGFDDRTAGIFIGATVHDVAQVVGAGFSVSQEAGDTATMIKLLRVTLLAPVVIMATLVIRAVAEPDSSGGPKPPLVPLFVLGFLSLAILGSLDLLPGEVVALASTVSRWLLLIAIASVGMKTEPRDILMVGLPAVALIVAETLFLAAFVLGGLAFLGARLSP